jgi:DNA-binding phage protein
MLRVSAQTTETDINLHGVIGDADAAGQGIEYGSLLMAFAEAVALRDPDAIKTAREALRAEAGDAVVIDAAGVAANFQRMVRIADSAGIPVDNIDAEMVKQTRAELSLDDFHSARNSLGTA